MDYEMTKAGYRFIGVEGGRIVYAHDGEDGRVLFRFKSWADVRDFLNDRKNNKENTK